ncbi:hypothetical protein [Marinactinospora rubrisoli]|uniref:Uncharacterized protein n=1 Tax=Marinactinospora rubrisoli TaxID=2715399 RepID=A0ABW2KB22_9ACTN
MQPNPPAGASSSGDAAEQDTSTPSPDGTGAPTAPSGAPSAPESPVSRDVPRGAEIPPGPGAGTAGRRRRAVLGLAGGLLACGLVYGALVIGESLGGAEETPDQLTSSTTERQPAPSPSPSASAQPSPAASPEPPDAEPTRTGSATTTSETLAPSPSPEPPAQEDTSGDGEQQDETAEEVPWPFDPNDPEYRERLEEAWEEYLRENGGTP